MLLTALDIITSVMDLIGSVTADYKCHGRMYSWLACVASIFDHGVQVIRTQAPSWCNPAAIALQMWKLTYITLPWPVLQKQHLFTDGNVCRNLGDNSITGVLPADWASGMGSLRGMNVTGNGLTGSLPAEWSNMTSLQAL